MGLNGILKYLTGKSALPTGPVPFGYKTGWFAVRSARTDDVVAALRLSRLRPGNWGEGISSGCKGSNVFVTPPVKGWVCVVGERCMGDGHSHSVELIAAEVVRLSAEFGEAHGYATSRIVEYHHWMLARQGNLMRCFAYLGEIGEVLSNFGALTDAETDLAMFDLSPEKEFRDEQDVIAVASRWIFDPTQLSVNSAPAELGVIGELR